MTQDQAIPLIVALHCLGFWILAWYTFRLRKRLRCLGYCYIDLGDWGINKIIEARDYYIERDGEPTVPFILLEAHGQFDHKLAYHRQLFAEVGHPPPGDRELNYPIESL